MIDQKQSGMDLQLASHHCRLLADSTRLRLLLLLEIEELSVAELSAITQLAQPRVSTHLAKLKDAGLVSDRRDGVFVYYRIATGVQDKSLDQLWQLLRKHTSDPLLLQQVFVNLIHKAVDAMVEVPGRPGVLEVLTNLDKDRVIVTIQDNGTGIQPEDQEKILNLFHTTKPTGKGTGLGLSIVHDLLYRLGGQVRLASEPGQWTRFVVEIPLNPPETPLPDPSISL